MRSRPPSARLIRYMREHDFVVGDDSAVRDEAYRDRSEMTIGSDLPIGQVRQVRT